MKDLLKKILLACMFSMALALCPIHAHPGVESAYAVTDCSSEAKLKADYYLNSPLMFEYSTYRYEAPYHVYYQDLAFNESFLYDVAAWELVVNTPDTVAGAVSGDFLGEKGFYEVILFDVLYERQQSDSLLAAMEAEAESTGAAVYAALFDYFGATAVEELFSGKELTQAEMSELMDAALSCKKVNKALGMIDDFAGIVGTAADVEQFAYRIAVLSTVQDVSDSTVLVLKELSSSCTDNELLKEAIDEVIALYGKSYSAQAYLKEAIGKKTVSLGSEILFDKLWGSLIESLGGGWLKLNAATTVGKAVANATLSTDATIESFYQMRALVSFENVLYPVFNKIMAAYKSNPSEANAERYNAALDLTMGVHDLGLRYSKNHLAVVDAMGLNRILNLFGTGWNRSDLIEKIELERNELELSYSYANMMLEEIFLRQNLTEEAYEHAYTEPLQIPTKEDFLVYCEVFEDVESTTGLDSFMSVAIQSLTINGGEAISCGPLTISSYFELDGSLTVGGDMRIERSYRMDSEDALLRVEGDLVSELSDSSSYYTRVMSAGTVELLGDLEVTDRWGYNATGAHTTVFCGDGPQEVSFRWPDAHARLGYVVQENPDLAFATHVAGFKLPEGGSLSLKGDLKTGDYDMWNGIIVRGGSVEVPSGSSLSATGDMELGDLRLKGSLAAGGSVSAYKVSVPEGAEASASGPFSVSSGFELDGALTVGGDMEIGNISCYRMDSEDALLRVEGDLVAGCSLMNSGSSYPKVMSAGTVELLGDLEVAGWYGYNSTGTHKTVFCGEGLQTVSFKWPGDQAKLGYVVQENPDLAFATPVGGLKLPEGGSLSLQGDLKTGVSRNSDNAIVRGGSVEVPSGSSLSATGDMELGDLRLKGSLAAGGSVSAYKVSVPEGAEASASGLLSVSNNFELDGSLTVGGDMRIERSYRMDSEDALLRVEGDLVSELSDSSSYYTRVMSAGTVELLGDLEVAGRFGYNSTGTHTTVFCGEGPQAVLWPGSTYHGYLKHVINAHKDDSELSGHKYGGKYIHDPSYETGDRYIQFATLDASKYPCTGEEVDLDLNYGSIALKKGADYEIVGESRGDSVGKATITVEGRAPYKGSIDLDVTIAKDIAQASVEEVPEQAYTGKTLTPAIVLTHDGKTLVKDIDYTVSYSNNKNAGTATATVTGKGDYIGSATVEFEIVKAANSAKVSGAGAWVIGGETAKPKASAEFGTAGLLYSRDGSSWSADEPSQPGSWQAKAVVDGSDNWHSAESEPVSFEVYGLATAPVVVEGLVYSGESQVGVQGGSGCDVSEGFGAQHAGSYVAKVAPSEGFAWADGSRDIVEIEWSIGKAALTAAYVGESVEYGTEPELAVEVSGFVGGEDASTASGYVAPAVKVPDALEPGASYELTPEGGFADDYSFEYASGVLSYGEKPIVYVEAPVAETGLVYSGSEQVGVKSGDGYVLEGDTSALAAGEYLATARLEEGHVWSDGTDEPREIRWSVAPATLTAAYVGESVAWNERPSLAVEVTGFVAGEDAETAAGYEAPTVPAPERLVPGESYELAPAGGSAGNYRFEYVPGMLSVGAVTFVDAPEAAEGLVYDGSEQAGVEPGEGYALSGASAKHAGEYVATAALEDGYAWSDGTTDPKGVAWSIEPAKLTAAYAGESVAWGEEPSLSVEVSGFVGGEDASTAAGYVAPTVAAPEGLEAGSAYELLPEGGAADDYVFEYVPGMLAVGRVQFASAEIGLSFEESVYDGSEQRPGVRVKMGDSLLAEGVDYELSYDGGCVLPGTYSVRITGVGSYEGSVSKVFVISKRQLADAEVSLSKGSFVYNGKVQRPVVSASYGGVRLTEGVDFEVAYGSGCKRSGSYGVTVRGIGTCEGEEALSFEIVDAKLSASNVTLSYASAAYTGAAKKPAATVRVNGVSQLKGEYAVTYWNKAKTKQVAPTAVGTYWVKVVPKAAANTTGTVWKSYKVNPKATANLKLTKLNNGFKASWTKRTVQCSGYQVSYKLTTSGTWKTKNVTGYKTNVKSVTGLKDKKTYQVKVRTYKTVNGVKYYSAWTGVKTVKTK